MARLNLFYSPPFLLNPIALDLASVGALHIQGVEIPGSLSFNNVAVILSGSGGVSEDMSLSFGLYSLNGSTLSLANSASMATGLTLNQTMFSWRTLATSATQDITPGGWYFAVMSSTSLGGSFSIEMLNRPIDMTHAGYGGNFARGILSVSTNAMPASIATTDLIKEGANTNANRHPYIIISA
jgi:hypothetical protein